VETDHDRPPTGEVVGGPSYNGTLFLIDGPNLHYCKPKQPDYWPTDYYIEVSTPQQPGQSLVTHNGQVYYLTRTRIYYIQGTGHTTFFPLPMESGCGSRGPNCAISVHGKGIYHVGSDGIYLFNGSTDMNITSARLLPVFEGETVGTVPGINRSNLDRCRLISHRDRLYFAYPSGTGYADHVLVFDSAGQIMHYDYGRSWTCFEQDEANHCLVAADSAGYLRRVDDPQDTTDDGTAITWEIRSKSFNHWYAFFPRSARWDVAVTSGATATGSVYLDDVVQQAHVLTGGRNTKRRLVGTCNGQQLAIGVAGSGPVKIYGAEVE
jgi:hypothetical protein